MNPIKQIAVSIREAAAMLSISTRSVQKYITAKTIPARKIGRRTVISVRALEDFMRKDQSSPASKLSGKDDAY
jgi:excisionase family DNA binding protein